MLKIHQNLDAISGGSDFCCVVTCQEIAPMKVQKTTDFFQIWNRFRYEWYPMEMDVRFS